MSWTQALCEGGSVFLWRKQSLNPSFQTFNCPAEFLELHLDILGYSHNDISDGRHRGIAVSTVASQHLYVEL